MSGQQIDYPSLKRGGVMRQTTPGLFVARLHVVAGNLDAAALEAIAGIARRHGDGTVHLTSRQGVEIPHVPYARVEALRAELKQAGLELGACGPRVRTVTGCQGSAVCVHGLVETRGLCEEIDRRFAGRELPHKLKFGVSGCRNSCLKPQENDLGIMGAVEPGLRAAGCTSCMACVAACESLALFGDGLHPLVDLERCNHCGNCIASCPSDAMVEDRKGYVLYLGGRIGRAPKLGERYGGLFADVAGLMRALEALVELYRREGRGGERFGVMLERLDRREVEALIERMRAGPGEEGIPR